jgi:hypothetical protein
MTSTDPSLPLFTIKFTDKLTAFGDDPDVVGFKTIVCYRTGLNVSTCDIPQNINGALLDVFDMYKEQGHIRLAHKALNDYIVRIVLSVAGLCGKPGRESTSGPTTLLTFLFSSPVSHWPRRQRY